MSTKPGTKYLTKTVKFAGTEVTLYSLDGNTWSTRKEELTEIIERHENGRVTFGDKGGGKAQRPVRAPAAPIDDEGDGFDDLAESEDVPLDVPEVEAVEEVKPIVKEKTPRPSFPKVLPLQKKLEAPSSPKVKAPLAAAKPTGKKVTAVKASAPSKAKPAKKEAPKPQKKAAPAKKAPAAKGKAGKAPAKKKGK